MSSLHPRPIEGSASTSSARHPPERRYTCAHCGATFNSAGALRDHKKQKVDQENKEDKFLTHVYCYLCDLDFGSRGAGRAHWNQNHAQKQNIDCPGCGSHFFNFSGFVQHIESNLCPKISQENATAADRFKMSLEFVKGLEELDKESGKPYRPKDFSQFLGSEREPAERVSWTGAPSNPWDNQSAEDWVPSPFDASEKSEFLRMTHREYLYGNTDIPDLLTGDDNDRLDRKQDVNLWASEKSLFPNAPSAQRPTSKQLDQLQVDRSLAVTRARNNFQLDVDDPNSPQFNADKYFNPYTRKYKCPKCRAGKSYVTKSALVQHIRSSSHKLEKEVSCPSCLNSFKSLHALAAHCEAEGKKCNFRHSDMYGMFLQQLTWNLIEVTGEHKEDGTKKYDITQRAREDFGVVKTAQLQPTFGHQQMYGPKPPTQRPKQVVRASDRPRQRMQNFLPELRPNNGYNQGATSQDADRFSSSFVDGPIHHSQHKQQQKQVDDFSWQNMETQQQQQQRGCLFIERGPLTAEALSKFNVQQAKNSRFELDNKRENESTTWSQGSGSWGLGNNSDPDDGYQGW